MKRRTAERLNRQCLRFVRPRKAATGVRRGGKKDNRFWMGAAAEGKEKRLHFAAALLIMAVLPATRET